MNALFADEVPYFRTSDAVVQQVYYFLFAVNLMYYTHKGAGQLQHPFTQTACLNFRGNHGFDNLMHGRVGAWYATNTESTLEQAVAMWATDEAQARATFGVPNTWDVSAVTSFANLFEASTFDEPIDAWDVSSGTTFQKMFYGASNFNQDLNSWAMSSATTLNQMFEGAVAFAGDISSWDVSNVEWFIRVFNGASAFNGDIGAWDVGSGLSFAGLFGKSAFNRDVSAWDVSRANSIDWMFAFASSFDQNLGWVLPSTCSIENVARSSACEDTNCGISQLAGPSATPSAAPTAPTVSPTLGPTTSGAAPSLAPVGFQFTDADIAATVDAWLADAATTEAQYGHPSTWDVSRATDFDNLFRTRSSRPGSTRGRGSCSTSRRRSRPS